MPRISGTNNQQFMTCAHLLHIKQFGILLLKIFVFSSYCSGHSLCILILIRFNAKLERMITWMYDGMVEHHFQRFSLELQRDSVTWDEKRRVVAS